MLAAKYKVSVDDILTKIDNDPIYADSLQGMFTKHDKNKDLHQRIYEWGIDPLTGLPGREEYDKLLKSKTKEVTNEQRKLQENPSWLFMIDCDHFKSVNDTYGHAAWDHALKEVVRIMRENIREGDFIARLGGDEFAIIMDGCSAEKVWEIWEQLRAAVKWSITYKVAGEEVPLWITLSMWVSPIMKDVKSTEIWADGALYCAKWDSHDLVASFPRWKSWDRDGVFVYIPEWLSATNAKTLMN